MQNSPEFHGEGRPASPYSYQERILPSTRTQPGWDAVEISWGAASETLGLLVSILGEIQKGAAELYSAGVESLEEGISNLGNLYRRFTEVEEMSTHESMLQAAEFVATIQARQGFKGIVPGGDRVQARLHFARAAPGTRKAHGKK